MSEKSQKASNSDQKQEGGSPKTFPALFLIIGAFPWIGIAKVVAILFPKWKPVGGKPEGV